MNKIFKQIYEHNTLQDLGPKSWFHLQILIIEKDEDQEQKSIPYIDLYGHTSFILHEVRIARRLASISEVRFIRVKKLPPTTSVTTPQFGKSRMLATKT